MHAIERFEGGDERPEYDALRGHPVEYSQREFTCSQSWDLLSSDMRAWAERIAGAKIRDPHDGRARYYWTCTVKTRVESGPGGGAVHADYDLQVFGRGGLAVAEGSTATFVDRPGGNRWKSDRWDLTIDEGGVRSAHLAAGAPNTVTTDGGHSGHTHLQAASGAARLLPPALVRTFGNLPAATQSHLLDPFRRDDCAVQKGHIDATTDIINGRYEERYACYLFNARWVAFAWARRSVPYRGELEGPDLWQRSPEAAEVRLAPWTVSAWYAPVVPPSALPARA